MTPLESYTALTRCRDASGKNPAFIRSTNTTVFLCMVGHQGLVFCESSGHWAVS